MSSMRPGSPPTEARGPNALENDALLSPLLWRLRLPREKPDSEKVSSPESSLSSECALEPAVEMKDAFPRCKGRAAGDSESLLHPT